MAEAVKIRLAIVLGGGYNANERKLTQTQRETVFQKDNGKCRNCGAQATEIDHITVPAHGDINHEDNLQALCSKCHREKTMKNLRPIETEEESTRATELRKRIASPTPLRACDSADWNHCWRQIAAKRRQLKASRRPG